eukprot:gene17043-biopygen8302
MPGPSCTPNGKRRRSHAPGDSGDPGLGRSCAAAQASRLLDERAAELRDAAAKRGRRRGARKRGGAGLRRSKRQTRSHREASAGTGAQENANMFIFAPHKKPAGSEAITGGTVCPKGGC